MTEAVALDHWTVSYGKFTQQNMPIFSKTKDFFENVNNLALLQQPIGEIEPPWKMFHVNTDLSLHDVVSKKDCPNKITALSRDFIERQAHGLAVYTDGSKNSLNQVGSGCFIPELNISNSYRLTDGAQVYTAELCAINEALKIIELHQTDARLLNRYIIIFTDSLSAVTALADVHTSAASHSELLRGIIGLTTNIVNKITFTWIPGHASIKGNDTADALAKAALHRDAIDIHVKDDKQSIFNKINDYVLQKWQDYWNESQTGAFYRRLEPVVGTKVKYKNCNRKVERIITKLRLGKCRLNKYLHAIKRHDSGLCNSCKVQESIEHYLFNCSNSRINVALLAECNKYKIAFNLVDVLANPIVLENCASLLVRQL